MTLDNPSRERPKEFTNNTHCWEALVAAIIKVAVDDYKGSSVAGRQKIEQFFRSELFGNISTIDPDWFIKNLEEMYKPKIGMVRGM